MPNLYCRLYRKYILGLIDSEEFNCDKESFECLTCEHFIDPENFEENTSFRSFSPLSLAPLGKEIMTAGAADPGQ